MWYLLLSAVLVYKVEAGGPATENYKDQFCTDPRTMKKHAAYSEWADAYSCTRHRCQPGGRSLAIYTVGCKRVEAPESAIECEEVVEDTNMQFPYCCTRLRCLVVVRGEVWTRVLGQPWESLPAAPWSHMYKIKKPPPPDASFLNKNAGEGPIYELAPEAGDEGKSKKHPNARALNGDDSPQPRNGPAETPDIVIALSTGNENEDKAIDNVNSRRQMGRKHSHTKSEEMTDTENEDNRNGPPSEKSKPNWAQIVPNQWDTENEAMVETENAAKTSLKSQEFFADVQADNNKRGESSENKDEKPLHLQALVDAIGTRMRDIENVVQRMSDKVNPANTIDETKPDYSSEKKYSDRSIIIPQDPDNQGNYRNEKKNGGEKRTNPESEVYKRFSSHKRNKYILTSNDPVTEAPLFLEDSQTGYFSGSSNVLRRGIPPKEPSEPAVYMAPVVEARRNNAVTRSRNPEGSEEQENKTKRKRGHKKKKKAINHRKRHHPRELKKSFNQINSSENLISSPENNSSA